MTSVVESGRKRRRLAPPRLKVGPLTEAQKIWAVVFSIVGIIVGTCVGVIVLAIIIGLADGH